MWKAESRCWQWSSHWVSAALSNSLGDLPGALSLQTLLQYHLKMHHLKTCSHQNHLALASHLVAARRRAAPPDFHELLEESQLQTLQQFPQIEVSLSAHYASLLGIHLGG